jgi:diguanylate cyclase (GGDEF)-like protein
MASGPAPARPRETTRIALLAGLAFAVAAAVGGAFVRLDEKSRREAERRAVTEIGVARVSDLEKQLDRAFSAAYALSVAVAGSGGETGFTSAAADILGRFPGIGALILAPAGTVPRIHPPGEAFAEDLPGDLAEDTEAHGSGRFTLAGPFAQGRSGPVVYGYLPFRRGSNFAGFTIAAVRVADLVAAGGLARLPETGYDYRLARVDPSSGRAVPFARSTELDLQDPVSLGIALPGGNWALSIAPRGGWRASSSLPRSLALVLVMSLLAAILSWNVLSKPATLQREVELRTRRLVEANRQVTREILQRERAERQLLHDASHDALTSLPNRAYFLSRLARRLETGKQEPGGGFAVLQLGLDRFKSVNDSLGPAAGDELLRATARRLEISLRQDDVAARVGGDEFAVLLADMDAAEAVTAVAQRLRETLARPITLDGREVFTAASVGIVAGADGYSQPEELLRDANLAMHRAKSAGGARHVVFERAMHDRALRLQTLEGELRRAIERSEFRVFYQPIVSLASGRISGFEALVRWQHPQHGFVPPGDFIPLAEATGLVVPIDRWVWAEAAREVRGLHERFPRNPPLTISVNLSTRQLAEADLLAEVGGVLEKSGLPPRSLRLEITESMMMDNTEFGAKVLSKLKTLDVGLLLDDFGTGYSSMSYLHELPIDILKVDRSFVSRLGVEPKHSEIVRTIIALARGLGMDVVAEGIETAEQLAQLRELGCGYGQGYFFSKPVPPDAAETMLASDRRW